MLCSSYVGSSIRVIVHMDPCDFTRATSQLHTCFSLNSSQAVFLLPDVISRLHTTLVVGKIQQTVVNELDTRLTQFPPQESRLGGH